MEDNLNNGNEQNNQIQDNINRNVPSNNHADIFCVISLLCLLLAIVLLLIFGALAGLFIIAGIVLMIYVRVKYPDNAFGKVLMWIYIVLAVISFIAIIAAVIFLFVACGSCWGSGMG